MFYLFGVVEEDTFGALDLRTVRWRGMTTVWGLGPANGALAWDDDSLGPWTCERCAGVG